MSFNMWKGNLGKMNALAMENWEQIDQANLINIVAESKGKYLIDDQGHQFINMVSCDYLGISNIPDVNAEIKKVIENGNLVNLSVSSVRIQSKLLKEVEEGLGLISYIFSIVIKSHSIESAYLILFLMNLLSVLMYFSLRQRVPNG